MSDNILDLIKEKIKYENIDDYIFKEKYGLIFVFKRKIFTLNNQLPSAEIKPLGLIYTENEDIYFAPFSEKENVKEIVKEYVKTLLSWKRNVFTFNNNFNNKRS